MRLGPVRTNERPPRSLFLLPLVLLGLFAFASPAQAAFGLDGLVASPSDTDAGVHSDFHTHLDVTTPGDQLRDLTVSLPPGLSGNPQSVPKCPVADLNADNCPDASQIGTTSADVTASSLIPLTIDGSVYNVEPNPGEPARLGIVLRPPDPTALLLPPIVQQVEVKLRPDFGLDTILTDLPQNAQVLSLLPVPIAINSVDLDLDAAFMRNPTSCGTKTTEFSARSWAMAADDAPVTGSTTFESTNCGAQAYQPNASLDINGNGSQLVKDARPTVTSVITQAAGEANNERAAVLLPAAIGIDVGRLDHTCPPADFQAGSCTAETKVGTAKAVSPLLDSDLTGAVYLITATGLPQVGVDLRGTLPLKIFGSTAVRESRLETIFEGLPDLPLSRFELTFPGGPNGLLKVVGDVCADSSTFGVDFTSQAGQKLSRTLPTSETGCPGGNGGPGGGPGDGAGSTRPQARIKVSGAKKHRPRVSIRVKSGGTSMSAVRVKLPRQLKLRRAAARHIVVKAGGKRIRGKKKLVAKGRTLKVRGLPKSGSGVVTMAIRPAAIRSPRKVRKGKKMAFTVKVSRPGQTPVSLKVRTRAKK